ncbi:hypothetical protein [Oculatella sp. FACHB-28]|uniref:hypothetical protein n=1 Tax=Oculatella sp. FACHB-28 TaxID=2692845 RepID=UPI0016864FB8|nr:hypothetical protein [Oculatella sp. FACHB-28]
MLKIAINSYYLLEKLEKFRNLIDAKGSVFAIIKEIADQSNLVAELIDTLQIVTLPANNYLDGKYDDIDWTEIQDKTLLLRDKSISVCRVIEAVPTRKFFAGIANLEEAINELIHELGGDHNLFAGLLNHLENFSESYERFLRKDSYRYVIDIVYSAKNSIESFETIVGFIDSLRRNLLEQVEYGESFQEMTIFLTSSYLCKEFIEKLNAIQEIYSELCLLINVFELEFPLKIIKIESGSLFAKNFGEAKVINILGELVKDTISFFYRKYTNEGKIQAISRQTEVIESVLELNKKLEQAGIDTSESKEGIRKSAVIIADKLNHLLLGEPEIELNREFISLDSKFKQKYMEGSRVFLLKGSDPELEDKG